MKNFIFRVLDLFCGGGGTSMGIHQALKSRGIPHKIVGVDSNPKLRAIYPFEFVCMNVLNINSGWMGKFDLLSAAPPCQAWSIATMGWRNIGKEYCDFISYTRMVLTKTGKPFFIENVPNAPLRRDLLLCGEMFGLKVFRHRIFEIHGFKCVNPAHTKHKGMVGKGYYTVVSGGQFRDKNKKERMKRLSLKWGFYKDWCRAMGINWIPFKWIDGKKRKSKDHPELGCILPSGHPLAEAIPPAYSRYITKQFLKKWVTLDRFL